MNKSIIFLLLGWFFLCVGCSDDDNCPGNLPDDTKEDVNQIKHIFLFGFDGWSAHSVENASMPTLKKLMAEGAYTLKNRSVLPSSSAPNWASMFMGVGPEWHGYTHWWSQEPELISVELNHYGMFPGIFGLVRDSLPQMEIGYLFDWKVMNFLVDTLAINYRLNVNKAVDKLTDSAVQYILNSKPDFCAVIYGEPDDTGHQYGWESPEYYSRLSE